MNKGANAMLKAQINARREKGAINKNLFGHFSEHLGRCIYQGIFVGEDSAIPNVNGMRKDVVEALKQIKVPVLRWPGGCFADEYHWRDGIGEKAARKRMVNTHWGGVVEDNSFGTHEFMELCRQIGCEPYVNGNVGSGTVREMSEWIEYMNSDGDSSVARERWANGHKAPFGVKYFGVGNENWGCGGNMRPSYYADEYRRYQTYCRSYGENKLFKIACGPSDNDVNWTSEVMAIAGHYMDALTMHCYTVPGEAWQDKGSATVFDKARYFQTLYKALKIDGIIGNHLSVMNRYDPEHRVGLIVDEWGCWHDVEPGTNPGFLYQQNTMRDAMVAALSLNVFISHCDRVVMANIAQMVNVLQAVILTDGDRMVLTPTYHVFDLYKAHMDAERVDLFLQSDAVGGDHAVPRVTGEASVKGNEMTVTLAHTDPDAPLEIEIDLGDFSAARAEARTLTGEMTAFNDFDAPGRVTIRPLDVTAIGRQTVKLTLPPCSVTALTISE